MSAPGPGACILAHYKDPERPRRALPGTQVCAGCHADLRSALTGEDHFDNGVRHRTPSLGELWTELEECLATGGRAGGAAVSGSRDESPLPFTPVVADHRRDIQDILASWVLQHMAEIGLNGPPTADPTVTSRWLATHLDHAVRQDWVVDYAIELRHLRGRARALLDPVRRTRFVVAQCITQDCPGWLVADVIANDDQLPSGIYCDAPADVGCGADWPPMRWMELGRLVQQHTRQEPETAA